MNTTPSTRPVLIWLIIGCVMIAMMVAIGGITRLTNSGLSMVEWKLFMGAVPPLNEQAWQETFEKYQSHPEYKILNQDMDLQGFKSIFFWEYLHRTWGRLMGIVFIIPFLLFLYQKKIKGELLKRSLVILVGGAVVGGLGWFMVLSGLKDRPDVSHYRLAIHLVAAFSLFGLVLWTALDISRRTIEDPRSKRQSRIGMWALILVYVQIIYGAFVAGLDAGGIYNTWPLMNGSFVPENTFSLQPFWKNLVEHRDGVQFIHRNFAYLVAIVVVVAAYKGFKKFASNRMIRIASFIMAATLLIQFLLGIMTLLMHVPVSLGVAHQIGALLLLAAVLNWLHAVNKTDTNST